MSLLNNPEELIPKENIKSVVQILMKSQRIQESSTKIMSFVVDDLLDYAQINAGKFRQNI